MTTRCTPYVGHVWTHTHSFNAVVDAISENDWIAVKMVDLYSELSVLCNATSDFCTESTCPSMRAGMGYEYTWADPTSSEYSTPTSVPARKYMELLMTWVDTHLNNIESESASLPAGSFNINIKIFCRRLFRVYAHVFCQHSVETNSIHQHLRYSLFHFILFMREYGLLVSDIEALPLKEVIDSLSIPNLHFPPH